MQVVLLRVGIDTGSGGTLGPVFDDGSFEFLPIPDKHNLDSRTYSNSVGRKGTALIDYFPSRLQSRMRDCPMHVDPEFESYTYGDPEPNKRSGLSHLRRGDLLVFYAGLSSVDKGVDDALYIIGYFEVDLCGVAGRLPEQDIQQFSKNFHVMHRRQYLRERDFLVLVKGSSESRLLTTAHLISKRGRDSRGRPLHVLSDRALSIFGPFGEFNSIERSSPPRRVKDAYVQGAAAFIRSLT